MTRINLVPPAELYDQHLMAEYREIFMVGSALQRSIKSKRGVVEKELPKDFTLNKGHVKFFYNKGKYLCKRYDVLKQELSKRGFTLDDTRIFKTEQWPDHLFNDWEPDEKDMNIVRERIRQRVSERPGWYRRTPTD